MSSNDSMAIFYRDLQAVTARIHDTDHIDEILLDVSPEICRVFDADRLTIYIVSDDGKAIVSKVKTGLSANQDLKLAINEQSLAGYCALHHRVLNIADVYDNIQLERDYPGLHFLKAVDEQTGYRTRQVLVLPVDEKDELLGVVQVINHKSNTPFTQMQVEGAMQLCKTLATAIRHRKEKERSAKRYRASKYDALVTQGQITHEELANAIQTARQEACHVEAVLIREHDLKPVAIGQALANFFSVVYEPFQKNRLRSEMWQGAIKREFVQSNGWMPLEDGKSGLVIMCLDPEAVRQMRLVPQIFSQVPRFEYRVTTQAEFEQTLEQLYPNQNMPSSIDEILANLHEPLEDDDAVEQESASLDNELVKFVNKIIIDAYQQKASDIHIEPLPGKAKTGIRFRVDGSLRSYIEVPAHFRQALVTRIKIMCDLDISEKRKPQDGKIQFKKFGPLDIELRVATLPSAGGVEDVVMRLLSSGEPVDLDRLGLNANVQDRLSQLIQKPHGLFYVCGPTGSGKTTTLHAILKVLNTPETKIWTAEDPVEVTQKGLRQVQINKKAGIDFALLMRAFLRADPDIIMVGESRDHETVSIGVESALTGHLVFSTLHTNSAPESIVRLLDMGMDPFNFSDALLGILAQRLTKKLCDCAQTVEFTESELEQFIAEYQEELKRIPEWFNQEVGHQEEIKQRWLQDYGSNGKLMWRKAKGCERCQHTGYSGRIGIHELMVASPEIKSKIQERAQVQALFKTALLQGMQTLKMDGMEKILQGKTDLTQVRKVCAR